MRRPSFACDRATCCSHVLGANHSACAQHAGLIEVGYVARLHDGALVWAFSGEFDRPRLEACLAARPYAALVDLDTPDAVNSFLPGTWPVSPPPDTLPLFPR